MKNDHVRSKQDPDMEKLRNLLLLMGGSVEQMISNTIAALIERDSKLAAQVVAMDQDVNALEIAIDEKCKGLLLNAITQKKVAILYPPGDYKDKLDPKTIAGFKPTG